MEFPPQCLTPDSSNISKNIAWLNVYVIVVIVLWLWVMLTGKKDRFDSQYNGDLTASKVAFASLPDSALHFTADRYAETPYPYDPTCGDVENAWQYIMEQASSSNPDIKSDPSYPGWASLYQNYLVLQHASATDPTQKQPALDAWNALQAYQDQNHFYPQGGMTPGTKLQLQQQDQLIQQYMGQAGNASIPATVASAGVSSTAAASAIGAAVNPEGFLLINPSRQNISKFAGANQIYRSPFAGAQQIYRSPFAGAPTMRNMNFTGAPTMRNMNFKDRFDVRPMLNLVGYADPANSSQAMNPGSGAGPSHNDDNLYKIMNGAFASSGL